MKKEEKAMQKFSFIKTQLRAIPIMFKVAPWHTSLNIIISIGHALLHTAEVIATKSLFDTIALATIGGVAFGDCVIPLLILAGVVFGQNIFNGLHNFHGIALLSKVTGKIKMLLYRKLQKIDAARFEETDFLDDLNKAKEGSVALPDFCGQAFMLFSFYVVYFVSMGAYLFSLQPILLITIAIAFIPALLAQIIRTKVFTKLEQENAPIRRENEYYQKALTDREYFKETRILGAYKFFHKLFSDTLVVLTKKTWRAERKTALLQLALGITSFIGYGASVYLLFTATMSGQISLGAFVAVFISLAKVFNVMSEVVNFHFGNMSRNVGKVVNFVRILDLPERNGTEGMPDFDKGVVAENVSFTYPGRSVPALKNVSLTIKPGETIAIVGENGAGKSTLVRLLIGVYRPSEGRVSVGGLDTAKTNPSALFQKSSGVFQKYQHYKMTLAENVSISKITGADSPDPKRIQTVLDEAGIELEDVAQDAMLSPEFDGIDLSGGQWQRLAIARGLYRENSFILLDEPTAAIDPVEETQMYNRFRKLAEGKCAVVVTHRLGSARLAPWVIVMDAGKIVDAGTHEELLARPGKYADMWAAQSIWYEREPDSEGVV